MPSISQHLLQAQRNRAFADALDGEQYPEWLTVAWFYCTLHLVDAFLATALPEAQAHPTNHRKRAVALAVADGSEAHADLWEHYRKLETLSRLARYEFRPESPEFAKEHLQRVHDRDFLPLVEALERMLS